MIDRVPQQPTVRPVETKAAVTDFEPRCWRCKQMVAWKASRPWEIRCARCHARNCSEPG